MKPETLSEAAARLTPNPDRHWVIPGLVRAGARIHLTGNAKSLVALEAAVSAATFTRFMGTIPPWVGGRALLVSDDMYSTVETIRKLLRGRRTEDESELSFVAFHSGTEFWSELIATSLAAKTRLIVVDANIDHLSAPPALERLREQGITVISIPEITGGSTWAQLRTWFDGSVLKLEAAAEVVAPLHRLRCEVSLGREDIVMYPLPETDLTKTEMHVWRVLLRLETATVETLCREFGYSQRDSKQIVMALESMSAQGLIEGKYVERNQRRVQEWSTILPRRET